MGDALEDVADLLLLQRVGQRLLDLERVKGLLEVARLVSSILYALRCYNGPTSYAPSY